VRTVLLAGGTGGAKLAHGFAQILDPGELTVIANVADDVELHGLHVSPDIDAILYNLAGLIDAGRGWGLRGDTFTALEMLDRLGAPTWFRLGDGDLATHVERTRRLRLGESLTHATGAMAAALGVTAHVLPATNDRLRTIVETNDGPVEFQTYFVALRQEPDVRGLRFDGADLARPTEAILDAIRAAELIVIGPSNPLVSIGPILAVAGIRDAIAEAPAPVVAVSPIVAGRALKGPADKMLVSLGNESSALGVARLYRGLADRFVLDEADAAQAAAVEELGFVAEVLPTIMRTDGDRAALARRLAEGRMLSP
jgi:LPPG:FO 2-phospho-L-lactate transferase